VQVAFLEPSDELDADHSRQVEANTLFEGAKTVEPIRVRNRGVLDALIIAALGPEVRGLAPAAPVPVMLNGVPGEHMPDFRLLTNTEPSSWTSSVRHGPS
jgi:hypothetical protein